MRTRNKKYINFVIFLVFLHFFIIFLPKNSYTNAEKVQNLTSAEAMVTIDAGSGRILYAKDENKRLPMASTTKIITAIVAIENCRDLDKKYEIPKIAN